MNLARITRRSLVVTGVSIGLVVGTVAIRTAADWTAASSTKAQPPAGMNELAARISMEQTRSAAIRAQIERLARGSDQLAEIIAMANRMAETDEMSADALRAELLDAKTRLAELEPAPAPAPARTPARRTTTTTTTLTSAAAPTAQPERDDDDHHDSEPDGEHHDD
jgi:hypothetical protein